MKTDFQLYSNDQLTELAKSNGINSWNEAIEFVKNLPYGRNKNRSDLGLVLCEKKGTCSSKHALLKSIADLNNIPNIDLIIGLYRMNELNTPKIGTIISESGLEYIPEAHCYLILDNHRIDITNSNSDFDKLKNNIVEEIEIEPAQVNIFKVEYHKRYLQNWITENKIKKSFEEIWRIREQCIKRLEA